MKIKVEIDTIDASLLESLLSETDLRRIFKLHNDNFSNLSLEVSVEYSNDREYGDSKLTLLGEREETPSEIKAREKRELAEKERMRALRDKWNREAAAEKKQREKQELEKLAYLKAKYEKKT